MLWARVGIALDLFWVWKMLLRMGVFGNALGLLWVCSGFEKCFYRGERIDNALGLLWICFGFALVLKMFLHGGIWQCVWFALDLHWA